MAALRVLRSSIRYQIDSCRRRSGAENCQSSPARRDVHLKLMRPWPLPDHIEGSEN